MGDLLAIEGTPVERLQGVENVRDRSRRGAVREPLVDQGLDVTAADVCDPQRPDRVGRNCRHRPLVGAHRVRLVGGATLRAHRAASHPLDVFRERLREPAGIAGDGTKRTTVGGTLRIHPPALGLSLAGERLADLAVLAGQVDRRLPASAAAAALAVAARASLRVKLPDPGAHRLVLLAIGVGERLVA